MCCRCWRTTPLAILLDLDPHVAERARTTVAKLDLFPQPNRWTFIPPVNGALGLVGEQLRIFVGGPARIEQWVRCKQ